MSRAQPTLLLLALGILFMENAAAAPDYANAVAAISRDIAALADEFPQLKDFSKARNPSGLEIHYSYRTYRSTSKGGWRAAAPEPDDDGIWFAINFHDPDSRAQIDTQPAVTSPLCIGAKRVTFLILEGRKTRSIRHRIFSILQKHGVRECRE